LLLVLLAEGCSSGEKKASVESLKDDTGLPMYYAGDSFAGLPLTHAEGWGSPAGQPFFAYGTCEQPKGIDAGGCAPPIEIQHFRFDARAWTLAKGCGRLRELRGVPAAHHDGLVLFTGTIVVKIYARTPAEVRRVALALRGVNTRTAAGAALAPPSDEVRRAASAACGNSS
jgi:hypothetical protein